MTTANAQADVNVVLGIARSSLARSSRKTADRKYDRPPESLEPRSLGDPLLHVRRRKQLFRCTVDSTAAIRICTVVH